MPLAPVLSVQRTKWTWNGQKWTTTLRNPPSQPPGFKGKSKGQEYDDNVEAAELEGGETTEDPYVEAEILADGTVIDYPALTRVMNGVTIGVQVASSIWRKMRQDLSEAISLPNKSHPAHGSNFDKKQRPEQQIVDWASVMQGQLRTKLSDYFRVKYAIYL